MNVMQMFDLTAQVAVVDSAGNEMTAARVRELGRRALTVRCDVRSPRVQQACAQPRTRGNDRGIPMAGIFDAQRHHRHGSLSRAL